MVYSISRIFIYSLFIGIGFIQASFFNEEIKNNKNYAYYYSFLSGLFITLIISLYFYGDYNENCNLNFEKGLYECIGSYDTGDYDYPSYEVYEYTSSLSPFYMALRLFRRLVFCGSFGLYLYGFKDFIESNQIIKSAKRINYKFNKLRGFSLSFLKYNIFVFKSFIKSLKKIHLIKTKIIFINEFQFPTPKKIRFYALAIFKFIIRLPFLLLKNILKIPFLFLLSTLFFIKIIFSLSPIILLILNIHFLFTITSQTTLKVLSIIFFLFCIKFKFGARNLSISLPTIRNNLLFFVEEIIEKIDLID